MGSVLRPVDYGKLDIKETETLLHSPSAVIFFSNLSHDDSFELRKSKWRRGSSPIDKCSDPFAQKIFHMNKYYKQLRITDALTHSERRDGHQ